MPRIGHTDLQHMDGVPPQMDNVDIQAVSIYGTAVVPGDTPLDADAARGLTVAQFGSPFNIVDGAATLRTLPADPDLNPLDQRVFPLAFNGTTWDRVRNNDTAVVLASAARGATVNSADQVNYDNDHMLLFLDITVQTAAETVQLEVEMEDPISGGYFSVWTAAAAVGVVGLYTYLLGPANIAALYTEQIHIVVPRLWRLVSTQVGVGPITYSVAAVYMGH